MYLLESMSNIKAIQWYPYIIILYAVLCEINSSIYSNRLPVMVCGCGGHRQYIHIGRYGYDIGRYLPTYIKTEVN